MHDKNRFYIVYDINEYQRKLELGREVEGKGDAGEGSNEIKTGYGIIQTLKKGGYGSYF